MRYFLQLSYDGTHYHGWQTQQDEPTIQQSVEQALSLLLKTTTQVTGAGRTDAGVHASFFVAHFDTPSPLTDPQHLCYKLNQILPADIAIHDCYPVRDQAHARFDATSRTYRYYISLSKSPFKQHYHVRIPYQLNVELMNQACRILFDYRDFSCFSKKGSQVKTNLCTIHYAHWEESAHTLVFTIQADRFLRNMVRAIVGTLLDIGRGKSNMQELRQIIESKDRCQAGASVQAKGLFLSHIAYPDNIQEKSTFIQNQDTTDTDDASL